MALNGLYILLAICGLFTGLAGSLLFALENSNDEAAGWVSLTGAGIVLLGLFLMFLALDLLIAIAILVTRYKEKKSGRRSSRSVILK